MRRFLPLLLIAATLGAGCSSTGKLNDAFRAQVVHERHAPVVEPRHIIRWKDTVGMRRARVIGIFRDADTTRWGVTWIEYVKDPSEGWRELLWPKQPHAWAANEGEAIVLARELFAAGAK